MPDVAYSVELGVALRVLELESDKKIRASVPEELIPVLDRFKDMITAQNKVILVLAKELATVQQQLATRAKP